ncbi:YihY/virulence factor BrkB family protein [Flavobacterium sp. CS20]|uniref:YihY/virulence factor BrkB family protein n=1 Tax=Flavobacterium sp. CS20 TaxID=2775246 RepID=UPI001B3A32B1|nr:YihY/virulence factor BrkB family protein [Flavobacterium sp. CS20]QTY27835.1 YihY/virulence factor BrkB family protein [Flavobacterium sp. CS20]
MPDSLDKSLSKTPIVKDIAKVCKKIKLPKLEGFTLYDLIKLYLFGIIKGTFSTRASSIAFSFFMAIFPFLLFILNLIPFITFIDNFQDEVLYFIEDLLPTQATNFFNEIFLDIANNPRAGLLSFVFLLSIFLMSNGVNAIFTSFEFSYHTKINRTIIRQYIVAVGVALIIAILLLISVAVTIYFTYMIENLTDLGIVGDTILWAEIGRYATLLIMLYLGIAILYYFGTREGRESSFFSIGALFTTFLITITTYLFSFYIENFSNYNKLYGSIGALLILMIYIWLNSNIFLLGFELNASIQKLKKQS